MVPSALHARPFKRQKPGGGLFRIPDAGGNGANTRHKRQQPQLLYCTSAVHETAQRREAIRAPHKQNDGGE
jgi:hypothetical protein